MEKLKVYDVAVIGGGIVGTATAMAILKRISCSLILIESEKELAAHQTGHNSGVIHSGLYYKPGSLKARNCIKGREELIRFCEEHQIKYDKCGKLVIAANEAELNTLNLLYDRGKANGLTGMKRLKGDEIKEKEPHAAGLEALFIKETGIVNFSDVTNTYAKIVREKDGKIETGCKFFRVVKNGNNFVLQTTKGDVNAKIIVNCAGLYSDRVTKLCGVEPDVKIIPFRGEYYKLKKEKEYLVKNLIYPVPDPRFPFLGVHFTRMIKDGVEAGPNAVLAFQREGYTRFDFNIKDLSEMFFYPGFWKMASKYYQMGFSEFYRSLSKKRFVNSLKKLIPEITINDITEGGSGVRAQALDKNGNLLDDFRIIEKEKMVHVLNAPSPAATASISIGEYIADLVLKKI
jgi:L-2-hydroxyglutarate oxidase